MAEPHLAGTGLCAQHLTLFPQGRGPADLKGLIQPPWPSQLSLPLPLSLFVFLTFPNVTAPTLHYLTALLELLDFVLGISSSKRRENWIRTRGFRRRLAQLERAKCVV